MKLARRKAEHHSPAIDDIDERLSDGLLTLMAAATVLVVHAGFLISQMLRSEVMSSISEYDSHSWCSPARSPRSSGSRGLHRARPAPWRLRVSSFRSP